MCSNLFPPAFSCFCFTSFCFCLQTLSPAVPHASAREGVCACVRRSAGSHTEASRICACLRSLTHLRKEIVYGLDQRDCLWSRASAQAWTKEIVCGLVRLRMRGPKSAGCSHGPTARAGLNGGVPSATPASFLYFASSCFPFLFASFSFASIPFCFASAYFAFFSSSLSATPFSASASPPPSSSSVSATPFSASASPPSPSSSSPPAFLHLLLLLLSLSHAPSQFKSTY